MAAPAQCRIFPMSKFLSPLKGWRACRWAFLWALVAAAVTWVFWGNVFHYSPFVMFFAAVAITAARTGPALAMSVAVSGVLTVLSLQTEALGEMWWPSISMLFNSGVVTYLGSSVRRSYQTNRDADEFRESIGDAVADFLWSCRSDGEVVFVNDRMLSYIGCALAEMKSAPITRYVHPEDLEELKPHFAQASLHGQKFSWPVRFRKNDGEYRWFQCRAVPIKDKGGIVLRWVGTSTDIDEQYMAEREREDALRREKEARIEAESVSQMKDEFLATISHELRTPLNAVFGWLQILKDPETTPAEFQEGLAIIDRNVHAQGQIVNDLLDMSGMVKGKVRLNLKPLDFAQVVKLAVESALPTAMTKDIVLSQTLEEKTGLIQGDEARMQQIVWNLLSNAIKFTPKGGQIDVKLARVDASLELSVTDSGEGINPNFLAHVFERFRQADATVTRAHGGLGLGLAITRQLVELHGGSIHAESKGVGRGATFRVVLPSVQTPENAPVEKPKSITQVISLPVGRNATRLKNSRLLVVDDDPATRFILSQILEGNEAVVQTASGGVEALEILASSSGESVEAVLCDLSMPVVSGFEFISRLRNSPDERLQKLPVMALTAFARNEDRENALLAGFNFYVSKPIEPRHLVAAVANLLQSR